MLSSYTQIYKLSSQSSSFRIYKVFWERLQRKRIRNKKVWKLERLLCSKFVSSTCKDRYHKKGGWIVILKNFKVFSQIDKVFV